LFYRCIKFLTRSCMLFFFRKKIICNNTLRDLRGPAIIASNHPNSMIDAIVIGCTCRQPVYFLIRSDMFKNRLFNFLLKRLNGIPIFRKSEDSNRMRDNFTSIEYCTSLLHQNAIIIIFVEGITLHDWRLKPLKSGISKITSQAITNDNLKDRLQVLPVGLTYSNYSHSSKTIIIQTGEVIFPGQINASTTGQWKQNFNDLLQRNLKPLIPEMTSKNTANIAIWESILNQSPRYTDCTNNMKILHKAGEKISQTDFNTPATTMPTRNYWTDSRLDFVIHLIFVLILFIPALTGFVLNGIFYFPVRSWVRSKTKGTIFYDSLLFGMLTIFYPVYILILTLVLFFTLHVPLWLCIIAIPATALSAARVKLLYLKISTYLHMKKEDFRLLKDFFEDYDMKAYPTLNNTRNGSENIIQQ